MVHTVKSKVLVFLLILAAAVSVCGCGKKQGSEETGFPGHAYTLKDIYQVNGRQGICVFDGFDLEVNHIGDIDVWQNELYLGVEYFMDGEGKNIQVAVYDGDTLELKRVFPFRADTGQGECSGIAVDPDSETVYMCSWIDDESSEYLYMYNLKNGDYKGRLRMDPAPGWIQGVAYYGGNLYVTCDDGDADADEPDHMYRIEISEDKSTGKVILEKTFDEVTKQGEIEGLSFDGDNNRFLLLYNRGARIVLGMPKGFYDGYNEEIHEVFVFDIGEK